MARHSRSKLPETWKEDFKYRIPLLAPGKVQDWLDRFLDHPDAKKAFEILGWESLDSRDCLQIYWFCRNAWSQAVKRDDILDDAGRMKDAQEKLNDVAEYIVELEAASCEAGVLHGNFYELLVDDASGLKVEETVPPAEAIPTILRTISAALPMHIRKAWRGKKPDRQVQQLLVLPKFFREKYDGEPYFDAIAHLYNATFPDNSPKNPRQIKEAYGNLEERLNPALPKKAKKKSKRPSKRTKTRR